MVCPDAARRDAGFTLAELLIVIAIVAVLVALAIPVFSSSLAKAEETTCEANRRALKDMVVTEYLASGGTAKIDQSLLDECVAKLASPDHGLCPKGGSYRIKGIPGSSNVVIVCSEHGLTVEDELSSFIGEQSTWGDDQAMRDVYAAQAGIETWPELIGTDGKKVYLQFKSYDRKSSGVFLYANSLGTINTRGQRWVAQYICDSNGLVGEPGQWYEVPKNTGVSMTGDTGESLMKGILEKYVANKVNLVNGTFEKM